MRTVTLRNYVEPKLLKTHEQSCNCSMFTLNGKPYLISRCVTYFLCDSHGFVMNEQFHTTNYLYEADENFNLQKIKELRNPYKGHENVKYNGLEDIRTIEWDGNIYFLCSKVFGNSDAATMCYGTITKDDVELGDFTEIRTDNLREKNWAPIESMPFQCMYSHSPLTTINLQTHEKRSIGSDLANVRGSSAIIRYNADTLMSLVHTKDASFKYVHHLVKYDNNLRVIGISQPFTFLGAKTEFCSTLKVVPDGVLLLPAINDGLSYVFNISSGVLEKLFNNQLDNDWVDPNLYNKLFMDAISNQAFEVAASSACLSTDKRMIHSAIEYNHHQSPMDLVNKHKRQSLLISRFRSL